MTSAAEIYANQLLPRRHGLPLWQPEPTKFGEVLIGDVGFILEGCFYRLFNAIRPADDPVNAHFGVPPDFVPLRYNETAMLHTTANYLPPGPLHSSSMRQIKVGGGASAYGAGAAYKFSCKSDQGALVVLGDHATRSLVLQSCTAFQQYMHQYHDAWHAFATALGHTLDSSEIVLVSGWLKTSSWALAACTSCGRAHEVSIQAQLGSMAGVEFGIEIAEDAALSFEQRSGPTREWVPEDGKFPRDQCLFLRYYKMKRRIFLGKRLVAAGSREQSLTDSDQAMLTKILADNIDGCLSSSDDFAERAADSSSQTVCADDDVSELEIQEEPQSLYHDPIDDLLDYILAESEAEVAIASHDDLFDLCLDGWPQDWPAFLTEQRPSTHVDADGVGRIRVVQDSTLKAVNPAVSMPTHSNASEAAKQQTVPNRPPSPAHEAFFTGGPNMAPCGHAFGDYCSDCTVSDDEFDSETHSDELSELDWSEQADGGPYAQADRQYLLLMALELLRRVERTRQSGRWSERQGAAGPETDPVNTFSNTFFRDPFPTHSASSKERRKDRIPDPGKYSARVLAAAPLAHVFLYRACMKWAARPGINAAAHLSIGVAAGAVLYKKRRLKKISSGRSGMRVMRNSAM